MAKIDHVFRELERVMLVEDGRVIVSLDDWTSIQEKYASKQPKKIPSVRKRPRKNRETLAEHQALKRQLFERANGGCEGARIRRDGELVREHAPDCPRAVPLHRGDPTHNKSRGSGGEWSMDNLRWTSRQCHRWEHNGGKVIPSKKAATLER